ncbi:MAG: hypothetical protein GAK28_04141 [Luteibacter sp.]|uniref:DUF4097 family beta strand repeat-containing protein n=1 Tax=Luteibacter sp. TaxID=1886636 RepID=UPI0013853E1E|nr:DUF4097 family beta strand repeat-containing protein [Luteibacter sp.]KAF1004280.1 MAG: hypothetical protein GAK28_04141 [Luteibacter sp.]
MRQLILAALLLAPTAALAGTHCEFHADRNLNLDLSGIAKVQFITHAFDLHVEGNGAGTTGSVRGKACASSQKLLDGLVVTQTKTGDTLTVELQSKESSWGFGSHYTDLQADVTIPATVPVQLDVGSGSAKVRGLKSLDTEVGSGELEANDIHGPVSAVVGSGEASFRGIGPLTVKDVGSGDLRANEIAGDATIGDIGSGDAEVGGVKGNLSVDRIGSGSLAVGHVDGALSLRRKGSGDLNYTKTNIGGKVDVPVER